MSLFITICLVESYKSLFLLFENFLFELSILKVYLNSSQKYFVKKTFLSWSTPARILQSYRFIALHQILCLCFYSFEKIKAKFSIASNLFYESILGLAEIVDLEFVLLCRCCFCRSTMKKNSRNVIFVKVKIKHFVLLRYLFRMSLILKYIIQPNLTFLDIFWCSPGSDPLKKLYYMIEFDQS